MEAKVIEGKILSGKILAEAKKGVAFLRQAKLVPKLAVILVGTHTASEVYVEKKKQACDAVGISFELFRLKETVPLEELTALINELNANNEVHAILVQLPLPENMDPHSIIDRVTPLKDVDGFTSFNLGLLEHGKEEIVSCTAHGVLKIIESSGKEIKGSNVCIVNHSIVVGRPLAQLLLNRDATVTLCHRFTKDLASFTREADILVTAVGKPGLILADMVKPGAVVVDAGISGTKGQIKGDVDFENVKKVASFITPVPGGVGPMTVACLVQNVVKLATLQKVQQEASKA